MLTTTIPNPNARTPAGGSGSMTWDSENRLLSLNGPTTRSLHRYDPFHRLVLAEAQTLSAAVWTTQARTRSVRDQFNLIEESTYPGATSTTASETYRYTWGRDLGGSLYAAGGVGGLLLMEKVITGAPEPWWYHHDANGNVIALTDATGTVAKTARYDAFGQMATWTAPAFATPTLSVHHNQHWFSTKPLTTDPSGGLTLHYYGYRWYLPQLGRWPSRDPIAEKGGRNLYALVDNNPVNWIDYLGHEPIDPNKNDPSEQKTDKKGNVYTRVKSCNTVIFLGHNNTLPHGPITGPACSQAARYSCGANASDIPTNPGIPRNPIPDAPDSCEGHACETGGSLHDKGREAVSAAEKNGTDLCKKCATGYKGIRITVNCNGVNWLDKAEGIGLLSQLCGTDKTVNCP